MKVCSNTCENSKYFYCLYYPEKNPEARSKNNNKPNPPLDNAPNVSIEARIAEIYKNCCVCFIGGFPRDEFGKNRAA